MSIIPFSLTTQKPGNTGKAKNGTRAVYGPPHRPKNGLDKIIDEMMKTPEVKAALKLPPTKGSSQGQKTKGTVQKRTQPVKQEKPKEYKGDFAVKKRGEAKAKTGNGALKDNHSMPLTMGQTQIDILRKQVKFHERAIANFPFKGDLKLYEDHQKSLKIAKEMLAGAENPIIREKTSAAQPKNESPWERQQRLNDEANGIVGRSKALTNNLKLTEGLLKNGTTRLGHLKSLIEGGRKDLIPEFNGLVTRVNGLADGYNKGVKELKESGLRYNKIAGVLGTETLKLNQIGKTGEYRAGKISNGLSYEINPHLNPNGASKDRVVSVNTIYGSAKIKKSSIPGWDQMSNDGKLAFLEQLQREINAGESFTRISQGKKAADFTISENYKKAEPLPGFSSHLGSAAKQSVINAFDGINNSVNATRDFLFPKELRDWGASTSDRLRNWSDGHDKLVDTSPMLAVFPRDVNGNEIRPSAEATRKGREEYNPLEDSLSKENNPVWYALTHPVSNFIHGVADTIDSRKDALTNAWNGFMTVTTFVPANKLFKPIRNGTKASVNAFKGMKGSPSRAKLGEEAVDDLGPTTHFDMPDSYGRPSGWTLTNSGSTARIHGPNGEVVDFPFVKNDWDTMRDAFSRAHRHVDENSVKPLGARDSTGPVQSKVGRNEPQALPGRVSRLPTRADVDNASSNTASRASFGPDEPKALPSGKSRLPARTEVVDLSPGTGSRLPVRLSDLPNAPDQDWRAITEQEMQSIAKQLSNSGLSRASRAQLTEELGALTRSLKSGVPDARIIQKHFPNETQGLTRPALLPARATPKAGPRSADEVQQDHASEEWHDLQTHILRGMDDDLSRANLSAPIREALEGMRDEIQVAVRQHQPNRLAISMMAPNGQNLPANVEPPASRTTNAVVPVDSAKMQAHMIEEVKGRLQTELSGDVRQELQGLLRELNVAAKRGRIHPVVAQFVASQGRVLSDWAEDPSRFGEVKDGTRSLGADVNPLNTVTAAESIDPTYSKATRAMARLGGEVVATGLNPAYRRDDASTLHGRFIRSYKDVIRVAQRLRSRREETFYWILKKGNKVVEVIPYSSRAIASSKSFMGGNMMDLYKLLQRFENHKDQPDSIMALHNHPSGDPYPSDPDIEATKDIASLLNGHVDGRQLAPIGLRFEGHTIINHNKGSYIRPDGTLLRKPVFRLKRPNEIDPTLALTQIGFEDILVNAIVRGHVDAANLAKAAERLNFFCIVGVGGNNSVAAIGRVPLDKLIEMSGLDWHSPKGQRRILGAFSRFSHDSGIRDNYICFTEDQWRQIEDLGIQDQVQGILEEAARQGYVHQVTVGRELLFKLNSGGASSILGRPRGADPKKVR